MTKKLDNQHGPGIIKYSLSVILLSMILIFTPAAAVCLAQGPNGGWWQTAQQGGLDKVSKAYGGNPMPQDARHTVVNIIKIVLGFLGILVVILILYAGFLWMTAGGNEEKISEAKKIITACVIGLVIILSAYAIANFVISQIYSATTGNPVLNP